MRIARILTCGATARNPDSNVGINAPAEDPGRNVVAEPPGFLGLGPIVSHTDLIVTLPRGIGEALARQYSLTVHACPVPLPTFEAKLHWHMRYHQDTHRNQMVA